MKTQATPTFNTMQPGAPRPARQSRPASPSNRLYIYIYICMYVCMYVCICICIYIYIYIYTHVLGIEAFKI